MKKTLITLSAVLFSFLAVAQNPFIEKWPNGNTKTQGFVIGDANTGATADKAEMSRQSANIVKDGKWTGYYENGKLRTEEHYNKGAMVGNWKVFYDNGVLESDINFDEKTAVFYHKSGKKHSEGGMISGMIYTGKWTCYYENGQKNYEGSYDNAGNKTGTWTWFDEQGKGVSEQVYQSGNVISTKSFK